MQTAARPAPGRRVVRAARQVATGPFDVAVLGGGLAGMATALRLQAEGLSTVVLESHGHPGGCAGYFRQRGYSFDVGATTLVDFEAGGVGAQLLTDVGLGPLRGEPLPGYRAWLPDRTVTLHRDQARWHEERLAMLGDSLAHRRFWALLDRLATAGWEASRDGVRLPIRRPADLVHNLSVLGTGQLPLLRHVNRTLGDALRQHGLRGDDALVGLLGMLVEDTVHSTVDRAPLVNAALGITIRGAGLTRHTGGMRGFWRVLVDHYRHLGGLLATGTRATGIHGELGGFVVETLRGPVRARQVVSALPAATTADLASAPKMARRLRRYVERDRNDQGGAIVAFLGVPEAEVADQELTHHQLMQDYGRPLGDGNNMFVSVSRAGDEESAPVGHRAVMVSTHTDVASWEGLSPEAYADQKAQIGQHLVRSARRAYPRLGEAARVFEVGTPATFAYFTSRPRGAVGGARQHLGNANQNAVPHDLGVPGLWLVGDSTWPGLGTVACVIGSRIVADEARRVARRQVPRHSPERASRSQAHEEVTA